ncbi:DedA family protein [Desulfitibacter alkalitolerans]|uniref:DedA family protein n=1 Tax=Desulfitibacter alkalitolerans TaxID=264641 RepID=UPI0004807E7C|nr:VTT domain-containing protein [Desulfitibacter alkalitolerans]
MSSLIDSILYYIILIGYPGIFFAMFLEGLSIPFPGTYLIIFAGFLVAGGLLSFWPTLLSGVLGFTLGSMGPFFMSFIWGKKLLIRIKKTSSSYYRKILSGQEWLEKYGPMVVVFSRPLFCGKYVSYFAGMAKMYPSRYFCYTLMGAYLWCGGLLVLGVLFKNNWQLLVTYSSMAFPGVITLGIVYYIIIRIYYRLRV